MFKIIMLYLLTIFMLLDAREIESEIGISIGLNSTKNEDGNKFKNPNLGLTYQDNKYVVMPRVDMDYTKVRNDYASALLKISVNGVYEYENNTYTIPYALAGVGYEYVKGGTKDVFEDNVFIQAGAGVRVDLEKEFKARLEAKVLQVIGGNNEGNEFVVTAGVSIPLSKLMGRTQKEPIGRVAVRPIALVALPVRRRVVIVNSNNNECPIKINAADLDRDGVPNHLDQCPATPCNFTVDYYGCPIKTTLKINFASNSSKIERSSMFKINNFANALLQNRGSRVNIIGHTDSVGSAKHNLALSQRRASAVVEALRNRGISLGRLHALGRGESQPIMSNKTKSGKAMNRRIDAELSYPKGRR